MMKSGLGRRRFGKIGLGKRLEEGDTLKREKRSVERGMDDGLIEWVIGGLDIKLI